MHARPPSTDPQSAPDRDNAYNVRSVPVRLYLPDGPVMQDVVPPTLEDGSPHTLVHYLSTHLPLLFPPAPYSGPELAYAMMHGVLIPPDAEMAWLYAFAFANSSTRCCPMPSPSPILAPDAALRLRLRQF
ncbi:hypothetical protein C8R48DRAFT_129446 [Suillus tomentosus]|nr:hypothetical protein C8R48DRAFT_129446 [Suillus tomentosus]